jgi:catechol 2,3-dioxygenase-like lactoylglutathione lyase family enzyme
MTIKATGDRLQATGLPRTLAIAFVLAGITAVATARQAAPAGAVTGVGNFSHIVASLDQSVRFYRDTLGLEVEGAPRLFSGDAAMRVSNAVGAQALFARLPVPGSPLGVQLIEYQQIERRPIHLRFHDPGAAHMILSVRDLDAALARAKKTGVVVGAGGAPVALGNGEHVALLEDPDGFFVQLVQADGSAPDAGTSPSPASGFELMVADVDRTARLYADALEFSFRPETPPDRTLPLLRAAGVRQAPARRLLTRIPGTSVPMTLVGMPRAARKAASTRFQDPGTPVLQLLVRDAGAVTTAWKRAGGEVVTAGGAPIQVGALKLAVLRDPNNLMIELIEGR